MPSSLLIRIEEGDDGWPVQLFVDDGEEDWLSRPAATDMIAPVAAEELEAMRSQVLAQNEPSPEFKRIGTRLYEILAVGDVGARWQQLAGSREGVRLLLDIRPEALSTLPWELLRRSGHLLATDTKSPFARVAKNFPGAGEVAPVRWPLRIMVVDGSEAGDEAVAAKRELAGLRAAFRRRVGLVDMEVLDQPSRDDIRDAYRQLRPHIFHFIGHGSIVDGTGQLELYNPATQDNEPWTAEGIDMDLAGWQPQLAILNACRSTSADGQAGAWSVADTFREFGTTAVIAMQGDILGDAAAAFSAGFYRALVESRALDVASAEGRAGIDRRVGTERRDFALPALSVSAPPQDVLQMRFGVRQEHREQVEVAQQRLWSFVDRTEQRRDLWRRINPDPDPGEVEPANGGVPADAIAIVGGTKVGKSELAKWCVGTCLLHDGNAAYVDFQRERRLDFLEALQAIRDALQDPNPVHRAGNRSAFERWSEKVLGLGADGRDRESRPWAPDAIETIFDLFGDALRTAAQDRPLLIVLDHVDGIEDSHWGFLSKWLLARVARHNLYPVQFIVVLPQEQRIEDVNDLMQRIELRQFKPEEFSANAGWYFRYHFKAEAEEVDELMALLGPLLIKGEWDWRVLSHLEGAAALAGWARSN